MKSVGWGVARLAPQGPGVEAILLSRGTKVRRSSDSQGWVLLIIFDQC